MIDATLSRFVRAALDIRAADDAGLAPRGRPSSLLLGRGGRSFVVRAATAAGPVVVKLRVEPDDDARGEVFGLRALPAGLGPRLIAHTTSAALRERAAQLRRFDVLVDLDAAAGALLVLEHLDGAPLPDRASPAALTATAATLRALHARRPRRGPPLAVPADLTRLLALARARAADLHAARALDTRGRRDVERALARASRHVEACWRRGLRPGARALCHGDLRRANLSWDGTRARLIDLEHAGLGDPALDLAMFATRSPLSRHEELLLLDAYLAGTSRARGAAFVDRYFAQRPLVALVGALDGALDLVLVARGERRIARSGADHWALRHDEIEDELARAFDAPRSLTRSPTDRAGRIVRTAPRASERDAARTQRLVAVDGHAASGKSQIAQDLAAALDVPWVNTGAAYRYAALLALRLGLDARKPADSRRLTRALVRARLALDDDGGLRVTEAGAARRLSASLGVLAIDRTVAEWAALPDVRAALAPVIARALARGRGVVEGRDVGSVLLPHAPHKLFVTASLDQRAAFVADKRGRPHGQRAAAALVSARDRRDTERVIAPLVRAPGARVLDTTGLTRERALARALALLGLAGRTRARGRA